MGHRFVEAALILQRVAQVHVRLGQIGPEPENLPICPLGVGQPVSGVVLARQGDETCELIGRIVCRVSHRQKSVLAGYIGKPETHYKTASLDASFARAGAREFGQQRTEKRLVAAPAARANCDRPAGGPERCWRW